MSQGRNYAGNRRNRNHPSKSRPKVGDKGREILEGIDESSAVIKQFRTYASELDARHDRYERIVKANRDITIESKRIIFLLHTIDKESKREAVLSEAKSRINTLISTLFKVIAKELDGQDPWQFIKAYRGGLQEFIEAVTFYYYLLDNSLPHWDTLAQEFEYVIPSRSPKVTKDDSEQKLEDNITSTTEDNPEAKLEDKVTSQSVKTLDDNDEEKAGETTLKLTEDVDNKHHLESEETKESNDIIDDPEAKVKVIKMLLPPPDFILGVADLTGELMRKSISNLATGDIDSCFCTCQVVREMHKGFLGCGGLAGREINRKLYTLKQSLTKMENVCYTITIRGSEVSQHMLADVAIGAPNEDYLTEDDEGYQGF